MYVPINKSAYKHFIEINRKLTWKITYYQHLFWDHWTFFGNLQVPKKNC